MAFNRQKAKQAGYSDAEIDAYLAKNKEPEQEAALPASIMRLLGGGGMADVAGTGFEVGRQARKALGQEDVEQNPYFTGEQAEGFKENPIKEIGSSFLSDLLGALGLAAGVGGVATFGTKAGVANLANMAAQRGKNIPWDTVRERATQAVSKFGNPATDVELRDTLNTILARINPNTTLGANEISSPMALQTRRQLLQRYGTNILDFLRGGPNLEQKVAGSTRQALSGLLHEAAPGTKIPDKLYSLYSKGGPFGGDIPSLVVKYGFGIPLIRKLLGPIGEAMIKSVD